ncbi:MAG: ribonuclease R [Planctomycetales bacterium]
MNEDELQEMLLEHVLAPGYRPVKPRKIAERLRLDEQQTRQLKKKIKRLVRQGKLAYAGGHAVIPPGKGNSADGLTGVFRRLQAGYGFVRPAPSETTGEQPVDIFIPAKHSGDAASGDTVRVLLRGKRGSKRGLGPAGEIIEIVNRETHRFVGTFFQQAGMSLVQVDGKTFSAPVRIGDATAIEPQIDEKVVIEMVQFPSHFRQGEAVILEILGPRNQPGVDTLSIIYEYGLPGDFPDAVLEEAREIAEKFDESIPPERKDYTDLTVVTIDPIDARDFDDAISLRQTSEGHWLLGVHIADVSHFIQEKTLLDREAYERATSVYLPDRVIPMLPETISNHLASLQPEKVRYTRSIFIEFTEAGIPVGVESAAGAIRSDRRFHYGEVDAFLASPASWKKKLTPEVHSLLGNMHTLAMILRQRRFTRGALELSMPEIKIDLDTQGRVSGAHLVENTESHQVIEEFMLAANEAVAELLQSQHLPFLRRVHEPPEPRKLRGLTKFVEELGIHTASLESRFALQHLLQTVAGQNHQHAVNFALLRSLQRAVYSPVEEGHFALASDCYCHFTSPIRRYPDLLIHRLLRSLDKGRPAKQKKDDLHISGGHCSDREQRAEQAERELVRVKLLNYLSTRLGEEMDAKVTGVQDYGLFVQGTAIPAEGLIHVASLADDNYHFDSAAHTLSGRRRNNVFRLGDSLRVAVAQVDVDRRELDFRLVHDSRGEKKKKASKRPQAKASRTSGRRSGSGKESKGAGKSTTQRSSKKSRRSRG